MKMIDLTHAVSDRTPALFGAPPAEIEQILTLNQDGCRESLLKISSHTGTHVDAPSHFLDNAKGINDYGLDKFFGLAFMLDVTEFAGGSISKATLEKYADQLEVAQFLVLNSGWWKNWGTDAYLEGYPLLDQEAAEYLTSFEQLNGIAVDMPSVDAAACSSYSIHLTLLKADKIIIENLTDLDKIRGQHFLLSAFPLKLEQADGSPVRAAAFIAPAGIYYPE